MRDLLMFPAMLIALAACGGDDPSPTESEPTHASVAGSYAGVMAGVSEGVTADMDFALIVSQAAGSLNGTSGISGTLRDGVDVVDILGTGTLTGTVATGNNPSVSIVVKPQACPANTANFSGSYDSTNRRLTITGPVQFYDGNCNIVLTFPTTFILNR